MHKLNFGTKTSELLPDAADPPSLLWTFALVAIMSGVAFTAVWLIITVLT